MPLAAAVQEARLYQNNSIVVIHDEPGHLCIGFIKDQKLKEVDAVAAAGLECVDELVHNSTGGENGHIRCTVAQGRWHWGVSNLQMILRMVHVTRA